MKYLLVIAVWLLIWFCLNLRHQELVMEPTVDARITNTPKRFAGWQTYSRRSPLHNPRSGSRTEEFISGAYNPWPPRPHQTMLDRKAQPDVR